MAVMKPYLEVGEVLVEAAELVVLGEHLVLEGQRRRGGRMLGWAHRRRRRR
jgi:hypothetical protein